MRHILARDTNANTVVILCDFEPADFLVPVDVMPVPAKVAEFYGARAEELARVVFAAVGAQPQKEESEPLPLGGEALVTRDGVTDADETVSDDQLDAIPTLAGWPPPAESTAATGESVEVDESA